MLAIIRLLLALTFAIASLLPSKGLAASGPKATQDAQGRWGATDAAGKTIVAFDYDYVSVGGENRFIVGRASQTSRRTPPLDLGVLDAVGHVVIPLKYARIEFDKRHHRIRVEREVGESIVLSGYFDEDGNEVVPVVYKTLERVSNMGDEPTEVAELNGKFGYIDFVTGRTLIPLEYDALDVSSLLVDAQGRGIARARKGDKWGVISTENVTLAPFEFDDIGDISPSGGTGLALRNGELVQVNFKANKYLGMSAVSNVYSSDFRARPAASLNPRPFDGLYIAQDCATMQCAWKEWRAGTLRWAAIPSLQVDGDKAYVSFGLFSQARLAMLPNEMTLRRDARGFALTDASDDAGKRKRSNFLTFRQKGDDMECQECERLNLPVTWRRVVTTQPVTFGGIGVAIKKTDREDGAIIVVDVLSGGPADLAGLRAGDQIERIGDTAASILDSDGARDALRGPAGSQIRLSVNRDGKLQSMVIERAAIQLHPSK